MKEGSKYEANYCTAASLERLQSLRAKQPEPNGGLGRHIRLCDRIGTRPWGILNAHLRYLLPCHGAIGWLVQLSILPRRTVALMLSHSFLLQYVSGTQPVFSYLWMGMG